MQDIQKIIDNRFEEKRELFATKEDIQRIETKISETKADLLKWMIVLFTPFYVGMIVFLIKQFI